MKLKSIILGADGYIGKHLCNKLMKSDHEVFAFGLNKSSDVECTKYQSIDITNNLDLEEIDWNVDFIFHFAGKTGTHISFTEYEDFNKVNILGLLNVLNIIADLETKPRIIFPSSRLVYKGQKNKALLETDTLEAKTIYAQNKISCEAYLKLYNNQYNISYTIFRIGVPYGNVLSSAYSYGTIGFFINNALLNNKVTIYGTGEQRRTFSYIEDITTMICLSLQQLNKSKNQIYNIGGENFSIHEIAQFIGSKFNLEPQSIAWPKTALLLESGDTIFDGSKLIDLINFKPRTTFKAWLESQNFK